MMIGGDVPPPGLDLATHDARPFRSGRPSQTFSTA
jgi:hypothetical protein